MFHKIHGIQTLPDNRLLVHFSEGVSKTYNLQRVIKIYPQFRTLVENEQLFRSVRVDVGGYGISWNDELDLSCDELWENGKKIHSSFDDLMSFTDAAILWHLNESTLRKAISYGKLTPNIDAKKFGKQWIVSRKAMEREYGKPI